MKRRKAYGTSQYNTMKIQEIIAMSAADRITGLRETVTKHSSTIKTASKFLVAFTIAGDCQAFELNAFAKKHLGMDIRKEIQGIYQTVKVLGMIAANELGNVTEDQFDSIPWSANIELSRFLNPESELWFLREKAINAYAGHEPVKNLKKLIADAKQKPEAPPTNAQETPTTEIAPTVEAPAPPPLDLETVMAWLVNTGSEMAAAQRDEMLAKLYHGVYVFFEEFDAANNVEPTVATAAA